MKKSLWLVVPGMLGSATPAWAEGEASGPLVVNGGLMIWTLIVFGLLFLVLRRFAWPVILGAVEAREKALEEQLADAQRQRAEAAALVVEQKKLLAEATSTARSIVAEAKAFAEKDRTAALEKTKHEQEDLLERARREIAAEREKAVAELRREAVEISLAAASKLVGQRFDSEADRRLVSAYLGTLGGPH